MALQNQPTPAELEILDILWQRKAATVREVYEEISERKNTAYTTVLKTMQIMQEKGLVEREVDVKAHVYRPRQSQRETQSGMVSNLLEKAFRGSALSLVQHVLEAKPASREELDEIRKMINEVEAKGERK
ncbi:MAG: BlaI/MecI/CopY family transcriptional regulator [Pyrinomonadaceae bacterium]